MCSFSAKLQTDINFAPVIDTGKMHLG